MNEDMERKLNDLGFLWSSCRSKKLIIWVKDTGVCHGYLHHGPSECLQHFIIKLQSTSKVATKYYIFFHLIPLFLRLRKVKQIEEIPKILWSSTKEYTRSILFMAFLVALLRAGLCVIYNPRKTILINNLGKFKLS